MSDLEKIEKYNDCPRQTDVEPISAAGRRMSLMDHIMGFGYTIDRNDFGPEDWETHAQWKAMIEQERARLARNKALLMDKGSKGK